MLDSSRPPLRESGDRDRKDLTGFRPNDFASPPFDGFAVSRIERLSRGTIWVGRPASCRGKIPAYNQTYLGIKGLSNPHDCFFRYFRKGHLLRQKKNNAHGKSPRERWGKAVLIG